MIEWARSATAFVEWNAVDAIGTWVVGAAAAYIAYMTHKTARIARDADERARAATESRRRDATAAVARVAFTSIISRRNRLAPLSMAAHSTAQRINKVTIGDLARLITLLEGYSLPTESNVAAYLSDMPGAVGKAVLDVYADEHHLKQGLSPVATKLGSPEGVRLLENDPDQGAAAMEKVCKAVDRSIAKADHAIEVLKEAFGFEEGEPEGSGKPQ